MALVIIFTKYPTFIAFIFFYHLLTIILFGAAYLTYDPSVWIPL